MGKDSRGTVCQATNVLCTTLAVLLLFAPAVTSTVFISPSAITDDVRLAGQAGDGRTPEGSVGLWEFRKNSFNFDPSTLPSWKTSGGAVLSMNASSPKFGPDSLTMTCAVVNPECAATTTQVSGVPLAPYAVIATVWVYIPDPSPTGTFEFQLDEYNPSARVGFTTLPYSAQSASSYFRFPVSYYVTDPAVTSVTLTIRYKDSGFSAPPALIHLDGFQVEFSISSQVETPFIDGFGDPGSNPRQASWIQLVPPLCVNIDSSQFWFAMRVRLPPTDLASPYEHTVFSWLVTPSYGFELRYVGNGFKFKVLNDGRDSIMLLNTNASSFAVVTIIYRVETTGIHRAYYQYAGSTYENSDNIMSIPTMTASVPIHLGSPDSPTPTSSGTLNGDFFWFMAGNGVMNSTQCSLITTLLDSVSFSLFDFNLIPYSTRYIWSGNDRNNDNSCPNFPVPSPIPPPSPSDVIPSPFPLVPEPIVPSSSVSSPSDVSPSFDPSPSDTSSPTSAVVSPSQPTSPSAPSSASIPPPLASPSAPPSPTSFSPVPSPMSSFAPSSAISPSPPELKSPSPTPTPTLLTPSSLSPTEVPFPTPISFPPPIALPSPIINNPIPITINSPSFLSSPAATSAPALDPTPTGLPTPTSSPLSAGDIPSPSSLFSPSLVQSSLYLTSPSLSAVSPSGGCQGSAPGPAFFCNGTTWAAISAVPIILNTSLTLTGSTTVVIQAPVVVYNASTLELTGRTLQVDGNLTIDGGSNITIGFGSNLNPPIIVTGCFNAGGRLNVDTTGAPLTSTVVVPIATFTCSSGNFTGISVQGPNAECYDPAISRASTRLDVVLSLNDGACPISHAQLNQANFLIVFLVSTIAVLMNTRLCAVTALVSH